ncbi:MAG: hypothetical protein JXO22_13815 [Phycisphaerae bacterium]|nr:hypothetical protein [Phycisphaerae bacterium]
MLDAAGDAPTQFRLPTLQHPPGLISQVFASAALSVFGSTAALLVCVHELSFHARTANHAMMLAGVAVSVGVTLGLWLLRRALARRLEQQAAASGPDARDDGTFDAQRITFDFAATLAGGLLLTLGVSWLLICAGAAMMESYRGWLTGHIGAPAWLHQVMLNTPLLIGLAWAGLIGAVALLALHGWQRLLTSSPRAILELWLIIALAAGAATLCAVVVDGQRVVMVVALATLFMGGSLAVWRKRGGDALRPQSPVSIDSAYGTAQLVLVATAAATVGIALISTINPQTRLLRTIAMRAVELPASVCVAMAVAWLLRRRLAHPEVPPLLVLAIAIVWPLSLCAAMPHVRLVGVAACATTCALCVAREMATRHGSTLLLLARVGTATAAGLAIGLMAGSCCTGNTTPMAHGPLISIAITAVVGLYLVLDRQPSRRARVLGLAAVACWLAMLPLIGHVPAPTAPTPDASPAARAWLVDRLGIVIDTCHQSSSSESDATNAWMVDLYHNGVATVLLLDGSSPPALRSREATLRLVPRALRTLALGGHLIVELPVSESHSDAARLVRRTRAVTHVPSRYLRIWRGDEQYQAVVFGNDIAAWLANRPLPDDATCDLYDFGE